MPGAMLIADCRSEHIAFVLLGDREQRAGSNIVRKAQINAVQHHVPLASPWLERKKGGAVEIFQREER